jgi:two-component system OmpR family sensor kinase
MTSLRARLFVGLAVVVLVTGLSAGGLAFRWAFDEAIELQDAILVQVGTLASRNRYQSDVPVAGGVDAEARVVIEELDSVPGNTQGKTRTQPLPAGLANGLQTISRGDTQWRVLVLTRADGSRLAISQPTSSRDEIAYDSALHTVLPLAALIPCLMLLIGAVVRYSFRPVSRLAAQLNAKDSNHLATLPLDGMPDEVRPFILSINKLLERIGAMFEQQRRFVADAAHELRTPIAALSLQAENLDHADLPRDSLDRLTALKTGIRRTAYLLEQLLALARHENGPAAAVPRTFFDDIAKEVVAELLPLVQARNIDLGFERIENVSVDADPTTLAVMVRNLIANALHHTPEGGRIDISLFRESDRATFRLDDTGPGIEETEWDRIFEPFYRGKRSNYDGTGLGLSIVRRIIDSLSGTINLANIVAPNRSGLRVIVSLPISDSVGRR